MKVTRKSILTLKTHTLDIDVTEEQLRRWNEGALIQDACPKLSDADREFIMSGITPEEWEKYVKDGDE